MAHLRDPFTDALLEPKLLQILRANRDVATHMADAEFCSVFEKLHAAARKLPKDQGHIDWAAMRQKTAHEAFADPRVMRAIMTLHGPPAVASIDDQLPDPVQAKHLEVVGGVDDAEVAKSAGNEFFKKGDLAMALAHYQRGITIAKMAEPVSLLLVVSLLSNASMCLLRLSWPDRAKSCTTQALRALQRNSDVEYDQSKLFYRRAMACEKLEEFAMAVDDLTRAFKEAQRVGLDVAEQQRLRNEIKRVKKLNDAQVEAHKQRDIDRSYWKVRHSQIDPVKEYEEANKWSMGSIEPRFDSTGRAHDDVRHYPEPAEAKDSKVKESTSPAD
jgi:tetratricopeptide (TPR) repeat protein